MMLLLLKYTSLWRVPADLVCQFLFCLLKVLIREYGNTFYVGMAHTFQSVVREELNSFLNIQISLDTHTNGKDIAI